MTNVAIKQVKRELAKHADKKRAAFLVGYMNTNYPLQGINVPTQRLIAKRGFSFSDELWDKIWKSTNDFEVLSQCLLHYDYPKRDLTLVDWQILKRWVKRIDNWAHSDSLSSLYAQLHEQYPAIVYAQYQKWNKSKHPWEVRASLVGLFYYAQARDRQPSFAKALAMIKGAFKHKDIYVQKGVGWTLREMYNVYPERTYAYLQNVAPHISPTAWYAATEKVSKSQKQALLKLRKSLKHL